jgi:hypothetical protein
MVVLLLLALAPHASAGTSPVPFGFRAAATLASLSFEDLAPGISDGDRLGYFLAGHVDFPVLPYLAIETGLTLAEQGCDIEGSGTFFNQTISGAATIRLATLYVPVLARFTSSTMKYKPFVKVGPQFGFLLDSKAEYETSVTGTFEADIDDDTEGTEVALYFSGGVTFPGRYESFIEVGYNLGLTGIADESTALFSDAKNRALILTAGFTF